MSDSTNGRSRFWICTVNNPAGSTILLEDTEKEGDQRYEWKIETFHPEGTTYCCGQLERGDEKTLHLQAYFEFKNAIRLSTLKKNRAPWSTCHWEPRRGSQEEAIAYCTKEDSRVAGPWEWGTKAKGQGKRSDLDTLVKEVKDGKPLCDIICDNPQYLRFISHAMKLSGLMKPQRREMPKIFWLYGDSGTGKSRSVFQAAPEAYVFHENQDGPQWWEGYAGEKQCIMDEFNGKYPFSELLQILNPYPHRIWIKGSSGALRCNVFIFTSNDAPASFYADNHNQQALRRRLNEYGRCYEFTNNGRDGVRIRRTRGGFPPAQEEEDISIEFDNIDDFIEELTTLMSQ